MSRFGDSNNFTPYSHKRTDKGLVPHQFIKDSRLSKQISINSSNDRSRVKNNQILEKQHCKVVKLIGDKQQNIDEMASGINCICGSICEFKNILGLLMDKIYRLREQRNAYKQELQSIKNWFNNKRTSLISIGINTDNYITSNDRKDQLRRLIEESQLAFDSISLSNSKHIITEEKSEPVNNHCQLVDFLGEEVNNETNLLQDSIQLEPLEKEVYKLQFNEGTASKNRPLRQSNKDNENNNLSHLCSFFKNNCVNLNKLQNYIEKVNCAKQIDRCSTKKRYGGIF